MFSSMADAGGLRPGWPSADTLPRAGDNHLLSSRSLIASVLWKGLEVYSITSSARSKNTA